MRMTPTLSQRGRHPKGSIPLTPLHAFFRFKREFLVNFLRSYCNFYVTYESCNQISIV